MWINRLIALALAGLLAACGGGSEPAASVAMAAAPSFDATAAVTSVVNASDPGSSLTVTKLTIVSSKRISRTIFEYAYNVTIANTSESQLQAVSATLVDVGSGTKIVAKSVTIGVSLRQSCLN